MEQDPGSIFRANGGRIGAILGKDRAGQDGIYIDI